MQFGAVNPQSPQLIVPYEVHAHALVSVVTIPFRTTRDLTGTALALPASEFPIEFTPTVLAVLSVVPPIAVYGSAGGAVRSVLLEPNRDRAKKIENNHHNLLSAKLIDRVPEADDPATRLLYSHAVTGLCVLPGGDRLLVGWISVLRVYDLAARKWIAHFPRLKATAANFTLLYD